MGLGFGLLSAQLRPGETDWTRAYDETVALAVEAERLGFASVWTTEHHFVDDGYMPSTRGRRGDAQATARISSARASSSRRCITRSAHRDAATVQLLSHGRLVLGLGLGWSGIEFAGLGADARVRGKAMDEILQTSRRPGMVRRSRTAAACMTCQRWASGPRHQHRSRSSSAAVPSLPSAERRAWPMASSRTFGPTSSSSRSAGCSTSASASAVTHRPSASSTTRCCFRVPRTRTLWRVTAICSGRCTGSTPTWKPRRRDRSRPRPRRRSIDLMPRCSKRGSTCAGTTDEIVEALLDIRKQAGVPVEFVARSYFPSLEYAAQVDLMAQLAQGVAGHV